MGSSGRWMGLGKGGTGGDRERDRCMRGRDRHTRRGEVDGGTGFYVVVVDVVVVVAAVVDVVVDVVVVVVVVVLVDVVVVDRRGKRGGETGPCGECSRAWRCGYRNFKGGTKDVGHELLLGLLGLRFTTMDKGGGGSRGGLREGIGR